MKEDVRNRKPSKKEERRKNIFSSTRKWIRQAVNTVDNGLRRYMKEESLHLGSSPNDS